MDLNSLLKKLDEIDNSDRRSIFESIGQGDTYFQTWEKEIHPVLCEVAIDPTQIQQLFKSIEQGAGRSALGKGMDAVKGAANKISDVWFNKFGGMLQSSGPVQAFDQKWEEIKSSVAAKHPDLAKALSKYKEFADKNPKTQKFLLGIAASAAAAAGVALAGGVAAGALAVGTGAGVATGIINIADRLLKNEKLSTAVGRGATAGLVAGITAGAMAKIGEWAAGLRANSVPIGDTGLEKITYKATKRIAMGGTEWDQMTQGFNVTVDHDTAASIREAITQIQQGDTSAFDTLKDIGRLIHSADYKSQMQAAGAAARDIALSNDSLMQWIKGLTQAATAMSGAAGTAAAGGQPAPKAAPVSESQLNELFGITGNKVDASKLQKAWEKAGSPTDSDAIAKILQGAGVDPAVISKSFTDMGLPEPAGKVEPTLDPADTSKTGAVVNIKDMLAQIQKLDPAAQKEILTLLKA
jgi:DNA-binding transcriptional regulator YdaS (Cro superfamily)